MLLRRSQLPLRTLLQRLQTPTCQTSRRQIMRHPRSVSSETHWTFRSVRHCLTSRRQPWTKVA